MTEISRLKKIFHAKLIHRLEQWALLDVKKQWGLETGIGNWKSDSSPQKYYQISRYINEEIDLMCWDVLWFPEHMAQI